MAKRKENTKKFTSIGGQALMEGIMMRGPEKSSMCVRKADGSYLLEVFPTKQKTIWNKIPIVRGVVAFVDSMINGSKMLMRSAEISIDEAEAEEKANKEAEEKPAAEETVELVETAPEAVETEEAAEPVEAAPEAVEAAPEAQTPVSAKAAAAESGKKNGKPKKDKKDKKDKKGDDSLSNGMLVISSILGVGLAVLLFVFLPTWIYNGILYIVPDSWAAALNGFELWRSLIEGIIKIALFLAYVSACTLMKDIYRVFQYHGAEHKSIFCYECGEELTVENVKTHSRFHPRCGTSFLIIMLIVGILVGILISCFLPSVDKSWWLRPLVKLALIPVIMGVGYELLKLAGRHDNICTRIISAPGLWMQRITTKEPDDYMIECAIRALKPVLPEDEEADKW